jgi:hypothetical protein
MENIRRVLAVRRRYLALALGLVAVTAYAFFVPVAFVPTHFACSYGCYSQYQHSSLTDVLLGHEGYNFAGHHSVH